MLLLHDNIYKWTFVEYSDSKKKDVWDSGEGSVITYFDIMWVISYSFLYVFCQNTKWQAINVRVDMKLLCNFENYM